MVVLSAILRRLGYIKLADYGLALGPGGTVISMRETEADWHLGAGADPLFTAGLAPSTAPAIAVPPALPMPIAQVAPLPSSEPVADRSASAPPVDQAADDGGAPDDEPSDDEWQWKLAMARARAAAEDAQRVEAASPAPPHAAAASRETATGETSPASPDAGDDAGDDEPTQHRLKVDVDRAARDAEGLEDIPTSAYRPAPHVGAVSLPLPAPPPRPPYTPAAPRRRLARGSTDLPAAEVSSRQAAARALAAARMSVSGAARGRHAPLPRLSTRTRSSGVPDTSGS
jgi:hypothetical protein